MKNLKPSIQTTKKSREIFLFFGGDKLASPSKTTLSTVGQRHYWQSKMTETSTVKSNQQFYQRQERSCEGETCKGTPLTFKDSCKEPLVSPVTGKEERT